LFQIINSSEVAPQVKQAGIIYFKNLVVKHWYHTKPAIHSPNLLHFLCKPTGTRMYNLKKRREAPTNRHTESFFVWP